MQVIQDGKRKIESFTYTPQTIRTYGLRHLTGNSKIAIDLLIALTIWLFYMMIAEVIFIAWIQSF